MDSKIIIEWILSSNIRRKVSPKQSMTAELAALHCNYDNPGCTEAPRL